MANDSRRNTPIHTPPAPVAMHFSCNSVRISLTQIGTDNIANVYLATIMPDSFVDMIGAVTTVESALDSSDNSP